MAAIALYIQPGFQLRGREPCFSGTPFAIKVQRVLQYKRLRFEVREVRWTERAELLPRISRSRKLPVLEYEGERIEDSSVIARFVEARHPEPRLIPDDPVRRALAHFLEEWADEVLYWYGIYEGVRFGRFDELVAAYYPHLEGDELRRAGEGFRAASEETLSRQGIGRYPPDKVKSDVREGLDGLRALVEEHGFAAAPELTLADVALFGQLRRRLAGSNPWLETEVAARPSLVGWLERVDAMTAAAI